MNRKNILPLIAAALVAALPLPASALELPRNGVVLHLAHDDDRTHGHWRWNDGRWIPFWALHDDGHWGDDDDDRWNDDRRNHRWDDDDDDRWDDDDDDDDDVDD